MGLEFERLKAQVSGRNIRPLTTVSFGDSDTAHEFKEWCSDRGMFCLHGSDGNGHHFVDIYGCTDNIKNMVHRMEV